MSLNVKTRSLYDRLISYIEAHRDSRRTTNAIIGRTYKLDTTDLVDMDIQYRREYPNRYRRINKASIFTMVSRTKNKIWQNETRLRPYIKQSKAGRISTKQRKLKSTMTLDEMKGIRPLQIMINEIRYLQPTESRKIFIEQMETIEELRAFSIRDQLEFLEVQVLSDSEIDYILNIQNNLINQFGVVKVYNRIEYRLLPVPSQSRSSSIFFGPDPEYPSVNIFWKQILRKIAPNTKTQFDVSLRNKTAQKRVNAILNKWTSPNIETQLHNMTGAHVIRTLEDLCLLLFAKDIVNPNINLYQGLKYPKLLFETILSDDLRLSDYRKYSRFYFSFDNYIRYS